MSKEYVGMYTIYHLYLYMSVCGIFRNQIVIYDINVHYVIYKYLIIGCVCVKTHPFKHIRTLRIHFDIYAHYTPVCMRFCVRVDVNKTLFS